MCVRLHEKQYQWFEISNFQLRSNTLTTNWQKMLEFYWSSDITCLWIRSSNCTTLLRIRSQIMGQWAWALHAKLSYIIKVSQNNWPRCVFFVNNRESPTPYFTLLEILKVESIFTHAQLSRWGVKCPLFLLFLLSH